MTDENWRSREKKTRNSRYFLKEQCEKKSFRIIREKFVIKAVLPNKEHFSPIFLFISVRFYLLRSISYSIMIFAFFFNSLFYIFSSLFSSCRQGLDSHSEENGNCIIVAGKKQNVSYYAHSFQFRSNAKFVPQKNVQTSKA